ncbi:MAG: hypothetical protein LBG64_03715 [Pseudomonadales bacterium]|jgi:hypothetical protein|nr:hypothetical protein [Pseudomonadales bacterium]
MPKTKLSSDLNKILQGLEIATSRPSSSADSPPKKNKSGNPTSKLIEELKNKKTPESKPKLSKAFISREDKVANPINGLQPLVLATLGVGMLAFGTAQFIRNANINYASEINPSPIISNETTTSPRRVLSFQGRLSAEEFNIISPKPMQFSLYDSSGGNAPPPTGGNLIWNSDICQVSVDRNGFFAVSLGGGEGNGGDGDACGSDLGNIFAENSSLYLQIQVKNEILFPRQMVRSVPFALNSETLQGFPASLSATPNTIPVINEYGNLVLDMPDSSIINTGNLNLISTNGDIFLLPGGSNVHIGNEVESANLIIHGDATISANLAIYGSATISGNLNIDGDVVLSGQDDQNIIIDGGNLNIRTSAGKDLSNDIALTVTQNGRVGLGTTAPSQRLSINQGNIGFDFLTAPALGNFRAEERGVVTTNGVSRLRAPGIPNAVTLSNDGGNIDPGTYSYAVTFVTFDGRQMRETNLSPITSVNVFTNNSSVLISNIDTYPSDNVVARNIYRTNAGGATYYLVYTLNDNLSTSFIDSLADNALGRPAPTTNNTGVFRYKVTFVTEDGATTNASAPTPSLTIGGDGRNIRLNNIPTDPSGRATARNIYRTNAGGSTYRRVATIHDNSTTNFDDRMPDNQLHNQALLQDYNNTSGGIFAGSERIIQFSDNGRIITDGELVAGGRVEISHGDNQGLRLPTSVGRPIVRGGQQPGDIVFDITSNQLFVFNGRDFIAQGASSVNPIASISDAQLISNGAGCNHNNCRVVLEPEYAGAVITTSGTNNDGNLSADHEIVDGNHHFNYYLWNSSTLTTTQSVDILIGLTLPNDFVSWQDNALTLDFATNTTNINENNVVLGFYKNGGGEFHSLPHASSQNGGWMSNQLNNQPLTISADDLNNLNLVANDKIVIRITPSSKNNNHVKLGRVTLNYNSSQSVLADNNQSPWRRIASALFTGGETDQVFFGGNSIETASITMTGLSENDTTILTVNGNIRASGTLTLSPISIAEAGECNQENEGKIYYNSDEREFFACTALDQARTNFAWSILTRTQIE